MKRLILLSLILIKPQFLIAEDASQCKLIGNKAESIMKLRQSNKDFFELYENYKDNESKAMLIEAFKEPFHNSLSQLSISINSIGERSHAADKRRYDELEKMRVDSISTFKMRYISTCLQKSLS